MKEIVAKRGIRDGRFSVNLLCSGISHAVSAGIAFFLTPFLIRGIGIETYGFYPIALEIMAIVGLCMGLINSTANRYVAVEYAGGRKEEARKYASTVFGTGLVFALLLLVPLAMFVVFSDRFLDVPRGAEQEIKLFFGLMLLAGLTDATTSVFGASYETSNRLDFRAVQELTAVFVKALLLWFLLSGVFPVSIVGVGIAVLASSVAGATVRFFMARFLSPELLPRLRFFSFSALRRVLVSGVWYSINEFGGWITQGGFLLLVNTTLGAETAGVYSLALTASRVLGGVMTVLAGVFLPTAMRQFASGDREALCEEILRAQKLIGFFTLVGVSMTVGFLKEFLAFWLGVGNTQLLRYLTVLAIVPMLSVATALPLFHLSVVMNRLRRMALLYAASALLGGALSAALIFFAELGVFGVAAVAFAVRVLWYSVFMPFYAARLLGVEPLRLFSPILRAYLGAGVSVGIIFALKSVCRLSSLPSILLVVAVSLCVVLLVGFVSVYGKVKERINLKI